MNLTVLLRLLFAAGIRHAAALAPPVLVSLFGESGCPDTIGFIFETLVPTEKALGEIMRVDWTPFGNAYYITKECGGVPAPAGCSTSSTCLYNSSVRECYFSHCGLGGHPKFDDCFGPGSIHCQHGSVECFANQIEACIKVSNPAGSWTISRCIEKAFYSGTLRNGKSSDEEITKVAKDCGATDEVLTACAGQLGHEALVAMAQATPPHPGVPYILVDGTPLSDETQLLDAVCKAYKGQKPDKCLKAALPSLESFLTAPKISRS